MKGLLLRVRHSLVCAVLPIWVEHYIPFRKIANSFNFLGCVICNGDLLLMCTLCVLSSIFKHRIPWDVFCYSESSCRKRVKD